jgi:hypothetical protein
MALAGKQLVITLAAAAAILAGVVWYAGRDADEAVATAHVAAAQAPERPTPTVVPVSAPAPAASASLAGLIADATSADAAKRATAIQGLGTAPRAEALPVLGGILLNGEPLVDRKLALASLRELALTQGDADGKVRDAVRAAIYHGDDFTPTEEVQETLDVIEESVLR